MENYNKQLFGKRLKSVRKMRGLSMGDLALNLDNIVSKQAISKYEQGIMMPSSQVIDAMSRSLAVSKSYFFREGVKLDILNFRVDNRIPAKTTQQMEAITYEKVERYLVLEDILAFDSVFHNPIDKISISSYEDAEKAATIVRKKWHMGQSPIFSVYDLLENHNVKVIEFATGEKHNVGCSTIANGSIPIIIINLTANETVERKRFTAIHELGHILLSFSNDVDEDMKERLCHRFAGAVLCPSEVIVKELGNKRTALTMNELISVKNKYGISVSAIVHRIKDLGIITEALYNKIYDTRINSNRIEIGWGGYPVEEHTYRFEQLLQRALIERLITIERASELFNIESSDYKQLESLTEIIEENTTI